MTELQQTSNTPSEDRAPRPHEPRSFFREHLQVAALIGAVLPSLGNVLAADAPKVPLEQPAPKRAAAVKTDPGYAHLETLQDLKSWNTNQQVYTIGRTEPLGNYAISNLVRMLKPWPNSSMMILGNIDKYTYLNVGGEEVKKWDAVEAAI